MATEVIRPQTFEQAYPGRFITGKQLPTDRPITVTIEDVLVEQLEGEKGKEAKVIAIFRERSKTTGAQLQLVLAKINAQCVVAMFGKRIADWYGKRLALYATDKIMPMPTAKGDDRLCVRVWGSPDIDRDMAIEAKMPRRKGVPITLHCTRTTRQEPASATQAPQLSASPSEVESAAQSNVCGVCGVVSAEGPVDASGRCVSCATANQ